MNKGVITIKKIKWSRVVSLVVLLSMLFSIVGEAADPPEPPPPPTTATEANNRQSGNIISGANAGVAGGTAWGYRIGLAKCQYEDLVYDFSNPDAKGIAVQEYGTRHYMRVEGECAFIAVDGGTGSIDQFGGRACVAAASAGPGINAVLNSVASNSPDGVYTYSEGGALHIVQDESIITQLMSEFESLGPNNAALVEHWRQESESVDRAKNPVVIVIEVVVQITGDGPESWWSAADFVQRQYSSYLETFLSSDLSQYGSATTYNGYPISTTCNAIANITGMASGVSAADNWPYRFTKAFFGVRWQTGGPKGGNDNGYGFHDFAQGAWMSYTDRHGINGCTIVTIGGSEGSVGGTYTWHINASRLPANAQGYQEDNVAESAGDKRIGVGAVDIKQRFPAAWQTWIMNHNTGGSFKINIQKYWTVGGNFSVQYEDIVGQRISSSTNTLSSGVTEKVYDRTAAELYDEISNGSDLDINGMQGGTQDTLGGSPLGEQYRVAYATEVKIIAPDGEEVQLTNRQVHYAIYGEDSDKTYKFNQILQTGRSQVKQGDSGLDSEEYEAMSGTPTTKDLFISQGAEQWLVQMQYRYVDETYLRTYELKSKEPYPNFMYYKVGNTNTINSGTHQELVDGQNVTFSDYHAKGGNCPANNEAYKTAYKTQFNNAATGLQSAIASMLSSIDNNSATTGYLDAYTVCAPDKMPEGSDNIATWIADVVANTADDAKEHYSFDDKFDLLVVPHDLDSSKVGSVKAHVKFTSNCTYGAEDAHDKNRNPSDGDECTSGDKWEVSYAWSITIEYDNIVTNLKMLEFDDILEQRYVNTRYLDIVELQAWRLSGGKQDGLKPILAQPTESVIAMACEQMGYCYYDSTQTNAREWVEGSRQWESEDIQDLDETGRLINSYGEPELLEALAGTNANLVTSKDKVVIEYSMENGGRSHFSYEAYFGRIAGKLFYNEDSTPRQNFINCSSDVFAINTGNSSSSGYETFCFSQFDTAKVKDSDETLKQYLMSPESNIFMTLRDATFRKDDHSAETPSAMNIADFQSNSYLNGNVLLSNMDTVGEYAGKYNKVCIAEGGNPFTFYQTIPEVGGVTWVGYKGDYLTTSASHEPELKCISGWTPEQSNAIMKADYYGRTWLDDESKNKLDDSLASPKSEYPHKEGLNVNRSQDNNRYATGYAAIQYERVVSIDHTQLAGVLPLAPFYAGASIDVELDSIAAESPGCAINAAYDASWTTPNDVVIFNPSTAENAYIKPATEHVPDTNGVGADNEIYPIRDQRVGGYFVGDQIFAEDGALESSTGYQPTSTSKVLRDRSLMPTTYYRLDTDYNLIENNEEKHSTISVGGTWTAPAEADYTLQVYDEQGNCTSVRVHLLEDEILHNINGDIYKEAKNAVVTWSDYITSNNVGIAAEARPVNYTIDMFVEEGRYTIQDLIREEHLNHISEYMYRTNYDVYNVDNWWRRFVTVEGSEDYFTETVDEQAFNDWINSEASSNAHHPTIQDMYYTRLEEKYQEYYLQLLQEAEDSAIFNITPTRVDTYYPSELGEVQTGDVIHLRYKFADGFANSTKPFDVNLVVNDSTAIDSKYIRTVDEHTWDYYIEFKKPCVVDKINVEFSVNTTLEALSNGEYMLEFVDMFMMSPGEAYSSPANATSTIDFVCLNNTSCAYNANMVDYTASTYIPLTVEAYKCYISYRESEVQYVLKSSSSRNPHKVNNSNWKYYVVGWKTQNGTTVKSPIDPILNLDDTVLKWPAGGTITVGELKTEACLVKYNGVVYLTTKEAGLDHRIMQTAMKVSSFDKFTFAESTAGLPEELVGTSALYPMQPGQTGVNLFQNAVYEFFFKCTTGTNSDGRIYDVQYAKNLNYKFDMNDTAVAVGTGGANNLNWQQDWEEVEVPVNDTVFGTHRVDLDRDALYLSLDDKFTVHYDNIGNYYETSHHNSGNMNVDLGFGWMDGMDTVTWIRYKYVQFPFDVYTFGWNTTYNLVDPTVSYEEYADNSLSNHVGGTEIRLVYHPAGEIIQLGCYEGDSGEADNSGHFIDFGDYTGYDYYFWVCLSSNEGRAFNAILNSSNINNNYAVDENKQENNKDTPSGSYWRYANAMRKHVVDVIGRIGNLTMLDTGDYRFSDTFKTTTSNAAWLVYGLIKKLDPYSNQYGVPSTQKSLLLDPWDVRGIGAIPSLLPSDYSGYQGYRNTGYSTYATQWHKVGDKTRIASLPLTAAFNDHDALKMTQQKIGYANLLTLDSIGNYFGSSGQYISSSENDGSSEIVNDNGDWGNQKIQVRPYYIAIDLDTNESYPVDVYMRTTTGYSKFNSGSTSARDYLATLMSNHYYSYLDSNTEDEDPVNGTYRLDQNMLRRMVTDSEASITYDVVKALDEPNGETRVVSMLTNPNTLSDREWDVASQYCYGNGQYLFLRARNRTFVGSNSIALNYGEGDITSSIDYKSHAQKWYFDLGLPTSAVFVKSGQPFNTENIINDNNVYILACVDVYAMGQVWDLHYKSPVSISDIEINNVIIPPETWNPVRDKLPWLIPVTFYDSSETTAKDDLTTEGTH